LGGLTLRPAVDISWN